MSQLEIFQDSEPLKAISPYLEMGAYEELWSRKGATDKTIANALRARPDARPSDLVDHDQARKMAGVVLELLHRAKVSWFELSVHGTFNYPRRLRDARYPAEVLYYQGIWEFVDSPCVAVVGTRKPSEEGLRQARQRTRELVEGSWTVVSGLAEGIDTAAHEEAIAAGGRTIGVLGTPISRCYPSTNKALQRRLAREHLIVSQVPVYRYQQSDYRSNRLFFPMRNHLMSALSSATLIVEAGDTSGTLIQAQSALEQGRKLLILESCFRDSQLSWARRLEAMGAIRVREHDELASVLGPAYPH